MVVAAKVVFRGAILLGCGVVGADAATLVALRDAAQSAYRGAVLTRAMASGFACFAKRTYVCHRNCLSIFAPLRKSRLQVNRTHLDIP